MSGSDTAEQQHAFAAEKGRAKRHEAESRLKTHSSFIVTVLLFLALSIAVSAINTSIPFGFHEYLMVALAGLSLGQTCFATVIAGLVGQTWVSGYLLSISLGIIFCALTSLSSSLVNYFTYEQRIEVEAIIFIAATFPFLCLVTAIPWFCLRAIRGWQLSRTQGGGNPLARLSYGGVLDLLITTAIVAAAVMCLQSGATLAPGASRNIFAAVLTVSAMLASINFLLLAPLLKVFFRCKSWHARLFLLLGAVGAITLASGLIFGMVNSYFWGNSLALRDRLLFPLGIPLAASPPIGFGLYALHWSGYRLTNNREYQLKQGIASERNEAISQESSLEEDAKSNPLLLEEAVSEPVVFAAKPSVRPAVICFILLSSVPLAAAIVSARRNSRLQQLLAVNETLNEHDGGILQLTDQGNIYDFKLESASGILPELLKADLSDVQGIKLTCKRLSEEDFILLENMNWLTKLDLSNTDLRDEQLDRLDLEKLHWVDVSGTGLTLNGVARLAGLSNIKHLRIARLDVDYDNLAEVLQQKRLTSLRVGDAKLENMQLSRFLSAMRMPSELDLSDTAIDENGLGGISCQALVLDGTKLKDKGFSKWLLSNSGTKLSLARTNLSDAIIPALNNSSWNWIDLSQTKITDDGLASLNGLSFQHLKISSPGITGAFAVAWSKSNVNVMSLDLSGTSVDDKAVLALGKLNQVQYLNLCNTKISSKAVVDLCESGQYREVAIGGCDIEVDPLLDVSMGNIVLHTDLGQFSSAELKKLQTIFTVRVGIPLREPF